MRIFCTWLGAIAGLSCSLLGSGTANAEGAKIALTFDDLPALTIFADQPYVNYLNHTLLRRLRQHHFPAIGFVNEGKLDEIKRAQQIAILDRWLRAGMDLGNHTFSHESPNDLGAKGYIADIVRGEHVTKRLLAAHHKHMRWFRHPYLETGFPEAEKLEIDTWLAGHGYRIAPVTIDADDWEWAEPYDDAIARHDEPRRRRLKAQYLAYTESMVVWYRAAAHTLFGRDISYVLLLHATRLNADSINDLAALFRRQELKVVSLDEAMQDPAYLTPDPYVGKDGVEWLERWALELHKDLPWESFHEVPEWVHTQYDKVDNDRSTHLTGHPGAR